jgi:hypothetical protein
VSDPGSAYEPAALLRHVERLHGLLAVGVSIVPLTTGRGILAANVLLGAGLVWGSVWLFKQLFSGLVRRRPERRRLAIALLFAKLPLLWGLLWITARTGYVHVDGLGLAAGITCFPVAVTCVALGRRRVGSRDPGDGRQGRCGDAPGPALAHTRADEESSETERRVPAR